MSTKIMFEMNVSDFGSFVQKVRSLDDATAAAVVSLFEGAQVSTVATEATAAVAAPAKVQPTIRENSTYYPLYKFLKESGKDELTVKFSEIAKMIGEKKLTDSATKFRAWWANNLKKRSGQSKSWLDAGYKAMGVDIEKGTVHFRKYA